jgi:hypothetical protein
MIALRRKPFPNSFMARPSYANARRLAETVPAPPPVLVTLLYCKPLKLSKMSVWSKCRL